MNKFITHPDFSIHSILDINAIEPPARMPEYFGHAAWYYRIITRNTRDVRYIYHDNKFVCALAPSWSCGSNGFLDKAMVVVRPVLNDVLAIKFSTMLVKASQKSGRPIAVKHLALRYDDAFIEAGFRRYRHGEEWYPGQQHDDQTFPEIVLDLDKNEALFHRGSSLNSVGADNYVLTSLNNLSIITRDKILERILCIFQLWKENFLVRKSDCVPGVDDWYARAFNIILDSDKFDLLFISDAAEKRDVAFFAISHTSESQIDVVIAVVAKFKGDFYRKAYAMVAEWAKKMSIQWMNLGGSEEKSLHDFKSSLGIHRVLDATHVLYDGNES